MKKERTWSSMNLRQNGMIIALIVIILGFGIATGGDRKSTRLNSSH